MALTDLPTVKTFLNIDPSVSTQDPWLDLLITAACRAVRTYCKRELETASYTEYLSGNDQPRIFLRQWPVTLITSLNLDPGGFYGKGTNAFSTGTLLVEGQDYVGEYAYDGNVRSGNIIRLGGGVTGTTLQSVWPWIWVRGSLTTRLPPVWPTGIGNVKVVYSAGHGTGPAASGGTLPEDLTAATNMLVSFMRRNAPSGGLLTNENLGQYSYALAQRLSQGQIPELGEARQLLQQYREIVL